MITPADLARMLSRAADDADDHTQTGLGGMLYSSDSRDSRNRTEQPSKLMYSTATRAPEPRTVPVAPATQIAPITPRMVAEAARRADQAGQTDQAVQPAQPSPTAQHGQTAQPSPAAPSNHPAQPGDPSQTAPDAKPAPVKPVTLAEISATIHRSATQAAQAEQAAAAPKPGPGLYEQPKPAPVLVPISIPVVPSPRTPAEAMKAIAAIHAAIHHDAQEASAPGRTPAAGEASEVRPDRENSQENGQDSGRESHETPAIVRGEDEIEDGLGTDDLGTDGLGALEAISLNPLAPRAPTPAMMPQRRTQDAPSTFASLDAQELPVVREYSAGGLIFDDQGRVAIIARHSRSGHLEWCLPKGHIEKGETPEQTAVREVHEETGILGEVIESIATIDYWFTGTSQRVHKLVHHYALRRVGGELSVEGDPDHEAEDAIWVDFSDLDDVLSYPNERKIAWLYARKTKKQA